MKPTASWSSLAEAGSSPLARVMRRLPIRWRILSIAVVTTALVLIFAALVWDGAKSLTAAWRDLTQVRQSESVLVALEGEAGRLQNLIHRYFNQPSEPMLQEIVQLRQSLLSTLRTQSATDPLLAGSVETLGDATERLVTGFDDLRIVQSTITHTYDLEVLKNAREMSGLYAIIESATENRNALIWPALNKSRDSFSTALLAINAFYFSEAPDAAVEARKSIDTIERTIPVMRDLADNDLQRNALGALGARAYSLGLGVTNLVNNLTTRTRLLRDEIDGNQAAMVDTIGTMALQMRGRELGARQSFEQALYDVFLKVAIVGILFLVIVVGIGLAVAASISGPLRGLMASMYGIVGGDYGKEVPGLKARDEVGEMARAVEVFRHNAIAKREAEDELRASKERAENALSELRDAQHSLIEAEKLAALGGLVAGVAHEVNNPIGISLTVASSFAHRSEIFARELQEGPLRRSRLDEFIEGSRNAAVQLVANLQRAGQLVQAFKQVAVDRSHADRRTFDLREATDQIVASLRPGLKKSPVNLAIEISDGIRMDSYPGPYGQVLTNLFLNAVAHGFADGRPGAIRVRARPLPAQQVEIVFADDGAGMSEEVQRQAFDPFFTTRRGDGGTGLGLHIVYNLVTYRLGGRVSLVSNPGRGTTFKITLPLTAPRDEL